MKAPDKKPRVQLVGKDGNVFGIIARCKKVLWRAGADEEYTTKFVQECFAQENYDAVLRIAIKHCEVV